MTYTDAIAFVESTLKFGSRPGLESTFRLMDRLGNPQDALRVIHVAGTNGKGSTATFMKQILMEAGYKVGIFTSPSLVDYAERIVIDDAPISHKDFAAACERVKSAIDEIVAEGHEANTEFEIFTAMAFSHFEQEEVDFAIMEVGMGGRLDATNVVKKPVVSVITPLALDHTAWLGDNLADIAREKGGIIKPGCPVVIHPQETEGQAVLEELAADREAPLLVAPVEYVTIVDETIDGTVFTLGQEQYAVGMLGRHQPQNATVAMTALLVLEEQLDVSIPAEALKAGCQKARWPGRLEKLSDKPLVLIDGAHNPHGAERLAESIRTLAHGRKVRGLVGMLGDKDVDQVLEIMLPVLDEVIVTEPVSERKMPAGELQERVKAQGKDARVVEDMYQALHMAWEQIEQDELLIVFGSFYLIGKLRERIMNSVEA